MCFDMGPLGKPCKNNCKEGDDLAGPNGLPTTNDIKPNSKERVVYSVISLPGGRWGIDPQWCKKYFREDSIGEIELFEIPSGTLFTELNEDSEHLLQVMHWINFKGIQI